MSKEYKRSHVTKAKISLYVALMDLDPDDYTSSDADLIYELSNDPDMKRTFHRVTKNTVRNEHI
jgi:hypothetical protein